MSPRLRPAIRRHLLRITRDFLVLAAVGSVAVVSCSSHPTTKTTPAIPVADTSIPFNLPKGTGFKGLPKSLAAEAWHEAVRGQPYGIPPGALLQARAQASSMPASFLPGSSTAAQSTEKAGVVRSALIDGGNWFPIGPAPVTNGQAWPGRVS